MGQYPNSEDFNRDGKYVFQPTQISDYVESQERIKYEPECIICTVDCTVDITDWTGNTVVGVALKAGIPYPFQFRKYSNISAGKIVLLYGDASTIKGDR